MLGGEIDFNALSVIFELLEVPDDRIEITIWELLEIRDHFRRVANVKRS